jgi:glycine dehydrogenase subunit 1
MAYILNTDDDARAMLDALGLDAPEELFDVVPPDVRLKRPLDVPPAMGELALTRHMTALADQNAAAVARPCFLGGGAYDHFVPAVVDQLAGRGEFFTAYTPYQAEASQGTLQAVFEYQTLVCQLTGMDVANASLYDGGSAVAEAILMALAGPGRPSRVVLSGTIHPESSQIVRTLVANLGVEVVSLPIEEGRTSPDRLAAALAEGGGAAAAVLQHPNVFGQLEPIEELVRITHDAGALAIVSVNPISLGLFKRPGDYGADIVVAEGQCLGNYLAYGGPYLGLMACREAHLRKLPGRLVGQTTDRDGKRCWVLTLQTREQHIRREKATSNICTNQGLLALRASIYLAVMGPSGLRQAAELCVRKAHYAAERLAAVPGVALEFDGPFFHEFAIRTPKPAREVLARVRADGFEGGLDLGRWFPDRDRSILVAVTEKRTREEIDGLVRSVAGALG